MDLADKIAKANEDNRSNEAEVDELGLVIRDDVPTYFVARAIKINTENRERGKTTKLLHHRGEKLYLGDKELENDKRTIISLCKPRKMLKDWEVQQIYDELVQHTPEFNPDIILISDHLYWDKKEGKLMESDEPIEPVV